MRNPFYFNINNTYLVKINYISQGDKFGRKKWPCLTFLQVFLMSGLREERQILISFCICSDTTHHAVSGKHHCTFVRDYA